MMKMEKGNKIIFDEIFEIWEIRSRRTMSDLDDAFMERLRSEFKVIPPEDTILVNDTLISQVEYENLKRVGYPDYYTKDFQKGGNFLNGHLLRFYRPLRKVSVCKVFLEELLRTENYIFMALVSDEGSILDESVVGSWSIGLHELAKNLGGVLSSRRESEENIEDLIIEFPHRKVYFEKLGAEGAVNPLWLMVCMDSRVLYYKQNLRRTIKRLNLLLYKQG